ncbi:hypothetical protein HOP50_14g73700 [Chloropicon primus]|uniref:Uncharacterized protein n=1 Tax=Chloropicon primus TaxID=1764295 RepID=A0A5B8MWA8_9CHLO|nr:hypothetical protein A3770_14p73470 [Chloropicon primus]UPR04038.1 hypothetical protein HOP50_14g73700 [Chloropicon primus]|eukprot:QDZ24829.1 hypothetical protein A3770_14p73470 [Chloropicon primus]
MADNGRDAMEAFGTPEKEAVGIAQEGWKETTPAGAGLSKGEGGELAKAAQAARLRETGALGFVGVEGMGSVIEAVQRTFNTLVSTTASQQDKQGVQSSLGAEDGHKLAEELRKDEVVKQLLNEPARMRESDGKYDTLATVLEDVASFGSGESSLGQKQVLEVEDVYNLFGLGGPDLDPYQSTSTFLTAEDSEVREKILQEHLCEESAGEVGQLVYFGGLGKSHLGRSLRAQWQDMLASSGEQPEGEEGKKGGTSLRSKVETEIGTDCIRNDLYLLNANTLQGSRPTMNGLSLSSVNHSVGLQNIAVPLHAVSEDVESARYLDASAAAASGFVDLSHLKGMAPTEFDQQGSNLSCAQALAALNACITLDPNASDASINRSVISAALHKFLPNTERERILEDSVTLSASGQGACSTNVDQTVDAKVLRNELIKSSDVLQLLQERREACNLDSYPLNDLREIKITISEITLNRETSFKKVWFETCLMDSQEDFKSISSSVRISGASGAHKTESLDIAYNLCEGSGSIYRSCQKILEGEVRDVLLLKVLAKEKSGEQDGVWVGTCELKLSGKSEQQIQKLSIMPASDGATIGSLRVRVEANAALACVKTFDDNCVPSYKLYIYGGLQRKQKGSQLVPSNRIQVYEAATNDLATGKPSGSLPPPTSCHASLVMGEIMLVHGGLGSKGKVEGQLHALHMPTMTWVQLGNDDNESAPGARFDHTATTLRNGNGQDHLSCFDVVFFGGEKEKGSLSNSLSILEVSNTRQAAPSEGPGSFSYDWKMATVSGSIPQPRAGHASASVSVQGREALYVFGGRMTGESGSGTKLSNEMLCGVLTTVADKKNFEWQEVAVEGGSPSPREKCTLHAIGTKLLMSHGWIGEGQVPWMNDLWLFDTSTRVWKRIMLENAAQFPTSRYGIGSMIRYHRETEASLDLYACNADGTLSKCNDGAEGSLQGVEIDVGSTQRFLLQSLDAKGRPCNKPGKPYMVLVARKMPNGSKVTMSYPQVKKLPQDTSMFAFEFTSVVAGDYDVEVFTSCKDSPALSVTVRVKAGEAWPDCFVVSGPATISCVAGETALLSIALHDKYGNSIGDLTDDHVSGLKALLKYKRESSTKVSIEKGEGNRVKASFVLQERGNYNVNIFYKGTMATSMDVKCLAGGISLPKTHLDPASVKNKKLLCGVECKFSVVLCDKSGIKIRAQDLQGSESMLKAFAEEYGEDQKGGSHVNDCAASVNKDGTLGFTFTPTRSGECVINVHYYTTEYKPRAIEGCPFVLKVSSSEIDPQKCKLVEKPPPAIVAGEVCTLLVQAKDKYGNNVSTSHEEVRCRVETAASKRTCKKIDAINKEDGTYEIKLQLTDVGSYTLHFDMKKEGQYKAIGGSPSKIKVGAAHLSPRHCTAYGMGIQGTTPAGETTSFVVVSRDPFGNKISTSGSSLEVRVQSGVSVPSSIVDNGDGTYTCSYIAGNEEHFHGRTVYSVAVKVNGVELEESPFFQRVYPPQTSAYNTTAVGVPPRMNSGESLEFIIQARDVEGRESVHGMDPFILNVELEEKQVGKKEKPSLTGEIKDLHNGKYLVKLFAEENLYAIASVGIMLGTLADPVQEHIKDSPFELMITPKGLFGMGLWGAKPSASSASVDESLANAFMLSGRGLRECVAGEEAEFDLTPVQGESLALSKTIKATSIDSGLFTVELRGPQFITGQVDGPTKDGHFRARYRPFVAGAYVLVVKIGRFVLQQCPFSVKCTPDVTCAETCEIDDFGLYNKKAGDDLKLKIITLDAQRNKNYSDEESFHVICRGGSIQGKGRMAKFKKHVMEADSKPLGDGIHQVVFKVPLEGAYSVIVLHTDRQTGARNELEASPVPFTCAKSDRDPNNEDGGPNAAAVSMKNLMQKAMVDSGTDEERRPNFMERRLKKILGDKDIEPEDHILKQDKPQPMFSAGLWHKPNYWEKIGIYTVGTPLRRVQYEVMEMHKKGLRKD